MQGPEFLHPANAEALANTAEEALTVLLHGPQPVVVCPVRDLERMRLKREYRAPLTEGLLLMSRFGASVRRVAAKTAQQHNRFAAALADTVAIAHGDPGDKTMQLTREAIAWGRPVYALEHPSNEYLVAEGVKMWDESFTSDLG